MQLAASIGSSKAAQSRLSEKEAHSPALHTAMKGMVDAGGFDAAVGDAGEKSVAGGQTKVPQLTDPIVAIAARAGLAIAAGQDVAMLAGENGVLATGADASFASGGQVRVHSGQAIGVLGGAIGRWCQGRRLGWHRGHRLWRQAGLQLPRRRPRRRIASGRPRPLPAAGANFIWAHDFVFDSCANGQ